jgi:hypothetical protein
MVKSKLDTLRLPRGEFTPVRGSVSTQERDMLTAFRKTPVFETHLTPTGMIAKEVNRNIEAQREARIKYIDKRLGQQKSRARDRFNRAR